MQYEWLSQDDFDALKCAEQVKDDTTYFVPEDYDEKPSYKGLIKQYNELINDGFTFNKEDKLEMIRGIKRALKRYHGITL